MKNRILATAILWSLAIVLPLLLGNWGAFLMIAVFGTGAFIELLNLLRLAGRPLDRDIAIPAFTLLLLAVILVPPWMIPPVAILFIGLCAIVVACLLKSPLGSFTEVALPTVGAVAFMLLPFMAIVLLVHESGLLLLIWVVAVTKFGDVGALLTGMWIGKHKMAPAFSPKKTWEGFAGGIALSVAVSVAFSIFAAEWLPDGLTPIHAAWTAVFISAAGVLGDLTESVFKREAKVKDSGTMIPGIGGFFDLVDSMTLAFPVAYFLVWIIL
jgi:phosphatidate cytidylyltransferase